MKKIGILSWKIGENSFGVTVPYLNYIERFGSVRILDYREEVDESLDLLILPGGPDINPLNYNAIPERDTGKGCIYREYFDRYILPQYINFKTPIFGICRGLQTLNVFFGGTLTQHMYHETSERNRFDRVHNIEFYALVGGKSIYTYFKVGVNSLHHQSIDLLGEGLKAIAMYKPKEDPKLKNTLDNQCIEAIVHTKYPIAAVQYHPEELGYDDLSDLLINDLLKGFNHEKYKSLQ